MYSVLSSIASCLSYNYNTMKFSPILALALLGVAMANPVADATADVIEVYFVYIYLFMYLAD